ncbi:MAG: hypothetical protein HQL34_03465 [Alphaproteobacteria bacterium]|nr:hypothetical protein [Alphaproteobacteria bacterium]
MTGLPGETGDRSAPLRMIALRFLGPAGTQALAQGLALASQLVMIRALEAPAFGSIGLALVAVNTVCFLGELGYGSYFLREAARNENWIDPWRHALGLRLIVLIPSSCAAFLALHWSAPEPSAAAIVLATAAPGILGSAMSPAPLLFGQGRRGAACAGILARAGLQAILIVSAAWVQPERMALWAGVAFSSGVLLQVLSGRVCGLSWDVMRPIFAFRPPEATALRLWTLSLVGTLNDRVLPFVLGAAHPDILAPALILVQVLQAMAGVGSQVDRVLVPTLSTPQAEIRGPDGGELLRRAIVLVSAFGLVFAAGLATLAWALLPGTQLSVAILVGEWAAVLLGGFAFALAYSKGAERPVAAFMVRVLPLSILLQVAAADAVPLEALLLLRLLVAAAVGWIAIDRARAACMVRP